MLFQVFYSFHVESNQFFRKDEAIIPVYSHKEIVCVQIIPDNAVATCKRRADFDVCLLVSHSMHLPFIDGAGARKRTALRITSEWSFRRKPQSKVTKRERRAHHAPHEARFNQAVFVFCPAF